VHTMSIHTAHSIWLCAHHVYTYCTQYMAMCTPCLYILHTVYGYVHTMSIHTAHSICLTIYSVLSQNLTCNRPSGTPLLDVRLHKNVSKLCPRAYENKMCISLRNSAHMDITLSAPKSKTDACSVLLKVTETGDHCV